MAAEGGEGGAPGDRSSVVGAGGSVKVVVVGDGAVGKTSLLVSYIVDRFPTEHVPTVFANYAKEAMVCGERVNLWLCDTAGQSLHSVADKWLPEVRFHCPTAQFLLVATKLDLRNSEAEHARLAKEGMKTVPEEEGQQLAKDLNMDGYIECSALTQDGLNEVFDYAARLALTSTKTAPRRQESRLASFLRRCKFL
nr:hypothetical protein BaRGS_023858 [Batillaria attramentaria]